MMTTHVLHISIHEFCEREGITEQQVVAIVEHGIVEPLSGHKSPEWEFDNTSARWMQKALRLQQDLDMDWVATATVIDLLRQREQLHRDNRRLRQRLQRFLLQD